MSSRKRIRKAVFPVAGLGTRFLPATKSIPKEMLPIVDKPLIQYAVEEALEAGIDTLIFITSRKKHAISDHFDSEFELETRLAAEGKNGLARAYHRDRAGPGEPRARHAARGARAWAMPFCAPSRWWATSLSPSSWRTT